MASKYLSQFELKEELFDLSVDILEAFIDHYGSESNYLDSMGRILTKEETEEFILNYLNELELTDQMYVNFGT